MRIGVNALPLPLTTGGGRYVFAGLLPQLLRLEPEHRYVVFSQPRGIGLVRQILGENRGDDRVRIVSVIDEEQIYPYRDQFDLYFAPLNNLRPRVYDRPTVAVLLDIQEQYCPQYFAPSELMARREAYPEICRSATTLIAISRFCKDCFVEKFGIDARKVEVVHVAPQAGLVRDDGGAWRRPPPPRPFFLYPANCYPHKNHALLLDAIAKLKSQSGGCPSVIFVGRPVPGGFPLRQEIARRHLEDCCFFFSALEPEEMRFLYRNAVAVVLPTMFEGFGMPAVEAMACGCPVVCSDIGPLREVAGDCALYFPPGDLEQLCRRLEQISSDQALRRRMIEAGPASAAKYTWEAAARRMLEVFAQAPRRFKFGYDPQPPSKPRPRIGILLRPVREGDALAQTLASIAACGYENLAIRQSPDSGSDLQSMLDFAREEKLDLVGQVCQGHRLLPSALDSLACSFDCGADRAVHLGEAATWRRGRYRGVARLRGTGDQLWKLEGGLYPEMMFLAPAALARWPAAQAILRQPPADWRWQLLRAARADGQLMLLRRTLADGRRAGPLAHLRAYRAGMFDFYRMDNGQPVRTPALRRFEEPVRWLSQFLPLRLQYAGTRLWYRLAR